MAEKIEAEVGGIDHSSEIDVEGLKTRFFKRAIGIECLVEVVCSSTDAGIGEDVVNTAVDLFSVFEKGY